MDRGASTPTSPPDSRLRSHVDERGGSLSVAILSARDADVFCATGSRATGATSGGRKEPYPYAMSFTLRTAAIERLARLQVPDTRARLSTRTGKPSGHAHREHQIASDAASSLNTREVGSTQDQSQRQAREMAKSATQEMAAEIARIAQTQVVEADRVSFACGPVTLKMVKTTLGPGWVLNDNVLFSSEDSHKVASAFYFNITANAPAESHYFNVRFGGTGTIVWRVRDPKYAGTPTSEIEAHLLALASLLESPPLLVG